MTREIPLTRGMVALVDDDDYERVAKHTWHAHRARQHRENWYARTTINGKCIFLHRFLMEAKPGDTVDHGDCNGLNCQRFNLRYATRAEQARNRRKKQGTTSRFIGVSFENHGRPGKPWRFFVEAGNVVRCGRFATEVEAAKARDLVAIEMHGEFARLNFPETN